MDASVLYQKALNIAFTAHKEQTDKAGMPYILHPLRLMFAFEDITLRPLQIDCQIKTFSPKAIFYNLRS